MSNELGHVYRDGEYVVRQGERGDCMFSILSGTLEVLREAQDRDSVQVAVLKAGEMFGEMAIFEQEVRSATVRARGDARVLTIDKRTFLRRIQEDPSIAFNLVQTMSRRLRTLDTALHSGAAPAMAAAAPVPAVAEETRLPAAPPMDPNDAVDDADAGTLNRAPVAADAALPSALAQALRHPAREDKTPPCVATCASGTDVRGWIATVAQRSKLGLDEDQACRSAWELLTSVNPFPSTLGRVCPHPCEGGCNRQGKDGAVAVNAMERYLGDLALARQWPLPVNAGGRRTDSIGVIGAGPAGLSFAYQMARDGYPVTVYERNAQPGGMLFYGIPEYRLPERVIEAEIRRIVALGIDLRLNAPVGAELSFESLKARHSALFVAIGACRGLGLGLPGEDGPGAWAGTRFLEAINRGQPIDVGQRVIVIGGGNTAIDAARAARRLGAQVTVVYRRSPREMPAIASEVEDALHEGVDFIYLAAPVAIERERGDIRAVVLQRMHLTQADASGRRAIAPVPGPALRIEASTVVAAVSQEPEWQGLSELAQGRTWLASTPQGQLEEGVWAGGDACGLGIAASAVEQGRLAALAARAWLQDDPTILEPPRNREATARPRPDYYAASERAQRGEEPVDQRLAHPELEVQRPLSAEEFLREAARCYSCGSCFGCEHCAMYCNASGFLPVEAAAPGRYFELDLTRCESCGKCSEICPSGYISGMAGAAPEPADWQGVKVASR